MAGIVLVGRCAVVIVAIVLYGWPSAARAECDGPAACCIDDPQAVTTPLPTRVRIGFRVMRIASISETDGAYTAELTLLTRWPAGGLRPALSPRNTGDDVSVRVDDTRLLDDMCFAELRMQGSFQMWFRLRRFPFDEQPLRLTLEDRRWSEDEIVYEDELWPNSIALEAFRELTAWRFAENPTMRQMRSKFAYPMASLHPALVMIEIPVARLWEYYVARYFMPLLLLVVIAYAIFWIKPDDLGSSAGVGITCMLAIIAFQLTQADTLPRVAYLTLADWVYTVCYVATAYALICAIAGAWLAARDRLELAERIDRRHRVWFPIAFVVALGGALVVGWTAHGDPTQDIPNIVPAAEAPTGEAGPV